MCEMLVQNWLTSSSNPRGVEAVKKRVWSKLQQAAQPSPLARAWRGFSWFFTQPIRTVAFSLVLLMVVLVIGHILPTHLRYQRWQRTQAYLDIEVAILEQENQLLEYVFEQ